MGDVKANPETLINVEDHMQRDLCDADDVRNRREP